MHLKIKPLTYFKQLCPAEAPLHHLLAVSQGFI